MAVEKRSGLKIEKEIPCQLMDVGRLHQSGGAKRTLVAVNDVEYVFNRIFAVEEFVTFRDHGHFIKSLFKDFAEMKDMGILQRDVILPSQRADKIYGLNQ